MISKVMPVTRRKYDTGCSLMFGEKELTGFPYVMFVRSPLINSKTEKIISLFVPKQEVLP
jgi:hypothetical protein